MIRRTLAIPAALCLSGLVLVALAGTGCLVIDKGNVTYSQKGKPISDITLSQIVEGSTTRSELTALLGPPSRKTKADGGAKVYVYEYRELRRLDTQVFLVLRRHGNEERHQRLYFRFKGDVVEKFWQD